MLHSMLCAFYLNKKKSGLGAEVFMSKMMFEICCTSVKIKSRNGRDRRNKTDKMLIIVDDG